MSRPALGLCACGETFPMNQRGGIRQLCDGCRVEKKREQRRRWGRTGGTAAMRRYRDRLRGIDLPDLRYGVKDS